jgi:hypothetical protein
LETVKIVWENLANLLMYAIRGAAQEPRGADLADAASQMCHTSTARICFHHVTW